MLQRRRKMKKNDTKKNIRQFECQTSDFLRLYFCLQTFYISTTHPYIVLSNITSYLNDAVTCENEFMAHDKMLQKGDLTKIFFLEHLFETFLTVSKSSESV